MRDFIWFGLIGLAMGLLARALNKGGRFGAIGDGCFGILGAVLGVLMLRFAFGEAGGFWGSAAVATAGAALLVLDLRLLQKSFAERRQLGLCKNGFAVLRRAPLVPRQADTVIETCRVCGQKHLF